MEMDLKHCTTTTIINNNTTTTNTTGNEEEEDTLQHQNQNHHHTHSNSNHHQIFDFISPKMEMVPPSTLTLTPIELIDPSDYGIDDNNNNFVTVTPMKSILDEMILSSAEDMNSSSSLELLGTFHWDIHQSSSQNPSPQAVTPMSLSLSPNPHWHPLNNDQPSSGGDPDQTEVTTLTNLITSDPLFVSFEDSNNIIKADHLHHHHHHHLLIDSSSSNHNNNNTVISSDLISTTYREKSSSLTCWPPKESSNSNQQAEGSLCDESLLRSALQAVKKEGNPNHQPLQGMTELRKVLSYPPIGIQNLNQNDNIISITESSGTDGGVPFYEFKILDPSCGIEDDSFLPNVEELIMTRNDPSFSSAALSSNGHRNNLNKTLSPASLSAKWTYTTNNNNNNNNNNANSDGGIKTIKKRNKKSTNQDKNNNSSKEHSKSSSTISLSICKENPSSPGEGSNGSSSNSNGANGIPSRKERSLHYCTICSKGFKDKYSVNVHVRTHTGEKPFACTLCGKSFRQKAHLAKHYQTHASKANSNNNNSSKGTKNNLQKNNSSSATPASTFS